MAGMTYLYRVRTVKELARSGWSAPVSGTTKVEVPSRADGGGNVDRNVHDPPLLECGGRRDYL